MLWEFSPPNNKEIYNLSNETDGIILKQVCTFFYEMGIVCLAIYVNSCFVFEFFKWAILILVSLELSSFLKSVSFEQCYMSCYEITLKAPSLKVN